MTHLYVAAVPDDASSAYDAVFSDVDIGVDHGSIYHASLSFTGEIITGPLFKQFFFQQNPL